MQGRHEGEGVPEALRAPKHGAPGRGGAPQGIFPHFLGGGGVWGAIFPLALTHVVTALFIWDLIITVGRRRRSTLKRPIAVTLGEYNTISTDK